MVGIPVPIHNGRPIEEHPIARCSQLNPVVESPTSPPLIDQIPCYHYETYRQQELISDELAHNHHITGLAITVSGSCGQPNETYHTGCMVCGKSLHEIKEEITLGYLEGSHIRGEPYDKEWLEDKRFKLE